MCLGSATAFGAMGVFGKLAFGAGATVGTLLAVRFTLAAALLWALLLAGGAARRRARGPRDAGIRALSGKDVAQGLALGAVAYASQAGGYFAALERIDASLLSLLVYSFPAMVAAAAIALGRERADDRRLTALALVSGGLVLVMAGAGTGALDPAGTALGLGAAVVTSAFVLVSEGAARRLPPMLLSALTCTGAAVSLTAGSALVGDLRPTAVTPQGWGWLVCLAAISTVAAITLFYAGLERVGPTSAAILSTLEPLVTVLLVLGVFGETLRPEQLAGGALILGGVLALALRPREHDGYGRARWPTRSSSPAS
jgi:drug/metabolite transporter (DMT)-like permease